jgi:hypothetical protein
MTPPPPEWRPPLTAFGEDALIGKDVFPEARMQESLSIDEALRRLEAAIELLEETLERRLDRTRAAGDAEGELHRLGADRSRLAQSLDAAEARSAHLSEINAEVSRGLVEAMESIRDVLARQGA